mgnify:CR=1 FL=1
MIMEFNTVEVRYEVHRRRLERVESNFSKIDYRTLHDNSFIRIIRSWRSDSDKSRD